MIACEGTSVSVLFSHYAQQLEEREADEERLLAARAERLRAERAEKAAQAAAKAARRAEAEREYAKWKPQMVFETMYFFCLISKSALIRHLLLPVLLQTNARCCAND